MIVVKQRANFLSVFILSLDKSYVKSGFNKF